MTKVLCWRDDCEYLSDGSICGKSIISLDEDGECECFSDYHEKSEWQEVFWKRMLDPIRKQECRVKAIGKRIEINGRFFFTESKSCYAQLTDEETGLICGDVARLNDNADLIEKITNAAKKYSLVKDLPIAVYDEKNRKFVYPNEESEVTNNDGE